MVFRGFWVSGLEAQSFERRGVVVWSVELS